MSKKNIVKFNYPKNRKKNLNVKNNKIQKLITHLIN